MKQILVMAMVMFATMVAADVAAVNTQETAEPVEMVQLVEICEDKPQLQPLTEIVEEDETAGECEHCKAVRLGLISAEEA